MQTKAELLQPIVEKALYATRLIIHSTQIARHTLFPSQEVAQVTTIRQRAEAEIEKRTTVIANDLSSSLLR
ncbi:hypothetical protein [Legionella taurinensis]|uniref:Uncharacterized protein n=1 Tax=Legionella taurinensis TaxID=70611 RepID=A0A3A5LEA9_9GAMM|nr:hypothetical protein [Legionella taurinensis]RJT47754.1 hypothetical protein D6J04_06370 [Legionella taurinensis]RJT67838.1 hypothetical protein D6J03_06510 [Legionella taurinensis]STY25817.1 Uncharacterised protein [Legionella taurinensis]